MGFLPEIRKVVLQLGKPFFQAIKDLHIPFKHENIDDSVVSFCLGIMLPGDVVLSRIKGHASNALISGQYKHASIYVGDGQIVEAVDPKVRIRDYKSFALEKDKICVLRSLESSPAECEAAAKIAVSCVGKPYDYDFVIPKFHDQEDKAMYCAELVWYCHERSNPHMRFDVKEIMGEPTVAPDDFLLAKNHWSIIFDA